MKIDKNKYCAYFTNSDQKQIYSLIMTISVQEADKYIAVMKKFHVKKIIKWFVLSILAVILLGCITFYVDQDKDPFAFQFWIEIGLFVWIFIPIFLLQGWKNRKDLIKNGKMFYIRVNAKDRIECLVEGMSGDGSSNRIYFYPVLGTTSNGYKSIWYVPECLGVI